MKVRDKRALICRVKLGVDKEKRNLNAMRYGA